MARKAKRRGRPPGSKSPDKMDVGQLRQYIDRLEGLLKSKVSDQRAYFEGKLSELSGYASAKASRVMRAIGGKKQTRRAGHPTHASTPSSVDRARTAALAHLPAMMERGLQLREPGGGDTEVTIRIPAVIGALGLGHLSATAHFDEQDR